MTTAEDSGRLRREPLTMRERFELGLDEKQGKPRTTIEAFENLDRAWRAFTRDCREALRPLTVGVVWEILVQVWLMLTAVVGVAGVFYLWHMARFYWGG